MLDSSNKTFQMLAEKLPMVVLMFLTLKFVGIHPEMCLDAHIIIKETQLQCMSSVISHYKCLRMFSTCLWDCHENIKVVFQLLWQSQMSEDPTVKQN